LLQLLTAVFGTKPPRAYATHVRSWWKLTYARKGWILVLTRTGHYQINFAVLHNAAARRLLPNDNASRLSRPMMWNKLVFAERNVMEYSGLPR
jgi:hypothetical protein